MKCPYCNEEMIQGFIQSPAELNWQMKRRLIGASEFNNDTIVLSEYSFIKGCAIVAYNCSKCKKIIIDYENNVDANKKSET